MTADHLTPEEIEAYHVAACACCDLAAMGGCGPACCEHEDHFRWAAEAAPAPTACSVCHPGADCGDCPDREGA